MVSMIIEEHQQKWAMSQFSGRSRREDETLVDTQWSWASTVVYVLFSFSVYFMTSCISSDAFHRKTLMWNKNFWWSHVSTSNMFP